MNAHPAQQFHSPVCLCVYETSPLQAFHGDEGAGFQAALLDAFSQRIQIDNPQVLLKSAAGGDGSWTAWHCLVVKVAHAAIQVWDWGTSQAEQPGQLAAACPVQPHFITDAGRTTSRRQLPAEQHTKTQGAPLIDLWADSRVSEPSLAHSYPEGRLPTLKTLLGTPACRGALLFRLLLVRCSSWLGEQTGLRSLRPASSSAEMSMACTSVTPVQRSAKEDMHCSHCTNYVL